MRIILVLAAILLVFGGGFSLFWFSEKQVAIRQFRTMDEAFSTAVTSQDINAIKKLLSERIDDNAKIQLRVRLSTLAIQGTEGPANVQNFTKASFIQFMDNILYSVNNYEAHLDLEEIILDEAKPGEAQIDYITRASASGQTYVLGSTARARWIIIATCKDGFATGEPMKFKSIDCDVNMSQRPDLNTANIGDAFKQMQQP